MAYCGGLPHSLLNYISAEVLNLAYHIKSDGQTYTEPAKILWHARVTRNDPNHSKNITVRYYSSHHSRKFQYSIQIHTKHNTEKIKSQKSKRLLK